MKRYITTLIALCVVSFVASAQVTKQVEVTKNFAPEIGESRKMDIAPNMVDTITLRPEIDYTVTPRSFASALGTHRFNPATVTYWEYQRKYPFYLKLGAGYPLNTVGDFYATTHRADVGYLTGYINHYGQYSKLKYYNGFDGNYYKDNRSMQMNNKFGVMGGKYFGRYTLSGDLYYRMDTYHRYPFHNQTTDDGAPIMEYKRRKIDSDDVNLALSFGDAFADYSFLNFKVYAEANLYNDKSENFIAGDHYQQINVNAGATIAREITKRSALTLDVNYDGYYGLKSLKSYDNSIVGFDLRYRYRSGKLIDLTAGAKVLYDNNPADKVKQNRWHAFPYLALSLNINDKGVFVPYVEVNGELQNNSYSSLVRRNPYMAVLGGADGSLSADSVVPNTELYNVRFGVSGHSASSKFAYRFYANMSFMKNAVYWYNINQIFFGVESASRNIWSLCGAVDYKPISQLLLTAQVKGSLYNGDASVEDAMPNVEALLRARYTHKKFTVGLSAELYGPTKWTCIQDYSLFWPETTMPVNSDVFRAPTSLNLSLYGDYRASKTCTVYAEVNNIVGDVLPTYHWAFYREMGASFTVGVKLQF
ncbi:MAG: hypothetical protein IKU93_01675 [Alistipes sp.]|nr:hypothetical protein [Alistipes sp.]